jgi:hypothetical protein
MDESGGRVHKGEGTDFIYLKAYTFKVHFFPSKVKFFKLGDKAPYSRKYQIFKTRN